MDKIKAKAIQAAMVQALAAVEKSHGVKFKPTSLRYSPDGNFTFKVEGGVVGADGTVATKEAEAFKVLAKHYGLNPEDLGATFLVKSGLGNTSTKYRVDGLRQRGRDPIIATQVDTGRQYAFAAQTVVLLLAKARADEGR